MAEQKKKETRPTKPEGEEDAAGANPEPDCPTAAFVLGTFAPPLLMPSFPTTGFIFAAPNDPPLPMILSFQEALRPIMISFKNP